MTRILRVALLLVATSATDAAAQQTGTRSDTAAVRRAAEQQLGRGVSQAELLERIRQSGMNRAQVRARLQQAGYDPGLADRYFDILERGGDPPRGEASRTFLEALSRIGVAGALPAGMADTTDLDPLRAAELERERLLADTLDAGRIEVFGLQVFRRASTQFQPLVHGPVDPGYRLGPGDELMLVLTGDVEAAYALAVTRDGHIFIPDVGQVSVAGQTLGQLEDMLYSRLGRVYSGISRSAGATTRFAVSIGQLRTNQVFVRGDVAIPGAHQVSSVAGLFNVLYQAGGPTRDGSFRRVEVHRGGELIHIADLYEFLVGGRPTSDIRLENNDHIFVPPAGSQVRVEGSVRRPAIYELRAGEGMTELLGFAGGLRSDALVRRVQVDRVLPPGEQEPGRYRTLLDVDLADLARGGAAVRLVDGDIVHVFAVSDERRNRVWVEGEVRNPGLYEWVPGATLWSALSRADGLTERAYTSRAHVFRLVPADGTRQLIQVTLEQLAGGGAAQDVPLMDNDSIVVLSRQELGTPETVAIDGFVKVPGVYPLARGMALEDLVLLAGGFVDGAYVLEAEVSRQPDPLRRTETTAEVHRISLLPDSGLDANGNPSADPEVRGSYIPAWQPAASAFGLQHGDRVFVRRAPGYETVREIKLTGQVQLPGTYVLARRSERLTDVLARAGGITEQAFPAGMHVVRAGHIVGADLQRALSQPASASNIILEAGDSIHVPRYDPTVTVGGAVNFEAKVLYVPGRPLSYYIAQAGGFADNADRGRTNIRYANGERAVLRSGAFGPRLPDVQPGAHIFVPPKPESESRFNLDQVVSRTAAILSATATMLIAITQLR
jgi:polysaccharide biosynthesis/export protein